MDTMTRSSVTAEQWEIAGRSARAWAIKLRPQLNQVFGQERRTLWNEILDGALADAGILPDRLPAFSQPQCVVCGDHPDANCEFCPAA